MGHFGSKNCTFSKWFMTKKKLSQMMQIKKLLTTKSLKIQKKIFKDKMLCILMKLRKYVHEKPLEGKLMKTPLCLVSIKRYETYEIK